VILRAMVVSVPMIPLIAVITPSRSSKVENSLFNFHQNPLRSG